MSAPPVEPVAPSPAPQSSSQTPLPDIAALWRALDAVPDPEIPVLSVVDLGMVRALEWEDESGAVLVVRFTPTYSGCPATEQIADAIREALVAQGVARVRVEIELSPPWTTDWMAESARQKLRDYGIAPPTREAGPLPRAVRVDVAGISPLRRAAIAVRCPRCGSAATALVSQFGSTACKALYRCASCREPFDYFKPH